MLVASSSLLTQSRDPTSNLSWIMHQRCSTGLADLWQICYAPCPYWSRERRTLTPRRKRSKIC